MRSRIPLIRVDHVSKTFKTPGGVIEVLRDVDFVIPEGSLTIIYGASGSGKSTLLNVLMGLEPPTTGKVTYESRDLYSMHRDDRAYFRAHTMGMVQQVGHWVKSLNVLDNVALPLHFIGTKAVSARAEAFKALKTVGMDKHARKYPSVLSGGEQQRVAMARALVNNPAYIVADEPTGSLDSHNGDAIMDLLRHLNKDLGRTVVLVTHNIEYLSMGDQLILMEDGHATVMDNKNHHVVINRLITDMRKRIEDWTKK